MQIRLTREPLCEAVAHLSRAVSSKTSIPVLEGILLSAEPSKLTIVSYNLELGMTKTLDADVQIPGDVVINARLFGDMLRRMNGEQVTLEVDDRMMCHISSGTAVFDIMGMPSSDFPEMPSMPQNQAVQLPGEILKNIVRQTIFAVAQAEGTRPILTGANFIIENRTLRMVAVDGYRLAVRKEAVDCDESFNFVVSGKTLGEAVRIISEENEPVTMRVGGRHIGFEINGYALISRLLDGEFLDYQRTIPAQFKQEFRLDTRAIIEAIERISLVINDSFKTPVRCNLTADQIRFTCASTVGRASETCAIQMTGPEFEIGINSRYLLEALRATETDEITVQCNDGTGPVVFRPDNGDAFLYMVMPMRLK